MDEKTKTAAGIAAGLQGMKYDDKRLAELAAEVEILNDAVRKAAAAAPHLRRRSGGVRQRHGEGRQVMRNEDLALEDLSAIADAIADGRITSVEATEACLARIEIWQPRTNAFLRVYRDKALAQARAMDAELKAGKRRGPLHGVPMAHKDMYYRKGELSTGGSAIRRDWAAPVTATVAREARCRGRGRAGLPQHGGVRRGPHRPQRAPRQCQESVGRDARAPAARRAARAPRWRRA